MWIKRIWRRIIRRKGKSTSVTVQQHNEQDLPIVNSDNGLLVSSPVPKTVGDVVSAAVTPASSAVTPASSAVASASSDVTPPSSADTTPSSAATTPTSAVNPLSSAVTTPLSAVTPSSSTATPPSRTVTPPSDAVTPASSAVDNAGNLPPQELDRAFSVSPISSTHSVSTDAVDLPDTEMSSNFSYEPSSPHHSMTSFYVEELPPGLARTVSEEHPNTNKALPALPSSETIKNSAGDNDVHNHGGPTSTLRVTGHIIPPQVLNQMLGSGINVPQENLSNIFANPLTTRLLPTKPPGYELEGPPRRPHQSMNDDARRPPYPVVEEPERLPWPSVSPGTADETHQHLANGVRAYFPSATQNLTPLGNRLSHTPSGDESPTSNHATNASGLGYSSNMTGFPGTDWLNPVTPMLFSPAPLRGSVHQNALLFQHGPWDESGSHVQLAPVPPGSSDHLMYPAAGNPVPAILVSHADPPLTQRGPWDDGARRLSPPRAQPLLAVPGPSDINRRSPIESYARQPTPARSENRFDFSYHGGRFQTPSATLVGTPGLALDRLSDVRAVKRPLPSPVTWFPLPPGATAFEDLYPERAAERSELVPIPPVPTLPPPGGQGWKLNSTGELVKIPPVPTLPLAPVPPVPTLPAPRIVGYELNLIGGGTSGDVFRATSLLAEPSSRLKVIAIKRLHMGRLMMGQIFAVGEEVLILDLLRRKRTYFDRRAEYVLHGLSQAYHLGNDFIISTKFYPSDLTCYRGKLWESRDLSFIIFELTQGLNYLHGLGIIHLDIKAGNIFITKDKHCVIGDYGGSIYSPGNVLVGQTGVENSFAYVTPGFCSPEVLRSMLNPGITALYFDCRADFFSLAITIYDLVCPDGYHVPRESAGHSRFLYYDKMGLNPNKMRDDMLEGGCDSSIINLVIKMRRSDRNSRLVGLDVIRALERNSDFISSACDSPLPSFTPSATVPARGIAPITPNHLDLCSARSMLDNVLELNRRRL
ncbi:hypothetical protein B0H34DRAFT_810007 [Crassisporium funariophilum]|nr:hypothetical protein B0H34DRAFT_810007 [Crassisporium funariophilum]